MIVSTAWSDRSGINSTYLNGSPDSGAKTCTAVLEILKSVHKLMHVPRHFNGTPLDCECALENTVLKGVSATRKAVETKFPFPQAGGIYMQFPAAG